jgi:hypothetical protein
MSAWQDFLEEVRTATKGVPYPFYRGCPSAGHTLLPSLFRVRRKRYTECNLFFDFFAFAKPLLDTQTLQPIEVLFEMRHAGIPTRLLDWTTTFAVALYFAVAGRPESPCVWVLEPDKLNLKASGHGLLVQSDAVEYDHEHEAVLYLGKKLHHPLAIFPTMQNARIFAQKGHFTIHGALEKPLEDIAPECLTRIPLPAAALGEARTFLHLAGLNEYSVFPDIDGLARYLIKEHGLERRGRVAVGKAGRKRQALSAPI